MPGRPFRDLSGILLLLVVSLLVGGLTYWVRYLFGPDPVGESSPGLDLLKFWILALVVLLTLRHIWSRARDAWSRMMRHSDPD